MVHEGEQAELRRWRWGWWGGLCLLLALMLPVVHIASSRIRERQTRDELAAMKQMLEAYQARYEGWPPAATPTQLLAAFRGKFDAAGRTVDDRWFLKDIRLHYVDANPDSPRGAVLDPWGRPYRYFHRRATAQSPESYVLFSSGSDGRYSDPGTWGGADRGAAPEDADNIGIAERR